MSDVSKQTNEQNHTACKQTEGSARTQTRTQINTHTQQQMQNQFASLQVSNTKIAMEQCGRWLQCIRKTLEPNSAKLPFHSLQSLRCINMYKVKVHYRQ